MNTTKNKLKTKDLITIGLLGMCNLLLSLLGAVFAFSPYAYLAAFPVMALLGGIVFFLLAARVGKPWTFFIYEMLLALVYLLLGYVPLAITLAVAAVVIEVIARKFGWSRPGPVTVCYVITCVAFAFGSYLPYLLFAEQMIQQYAQEFGEEYMRVSAGLITPLNTVILLAINVVCALVGSLIAKKLLKKHFVKAGKV